MRETRGKNRDLKELVDFQSHALEFCQQVSQLGQQIGAYAQEASVSLQDDVSDATLRKVEAISDKLKRMGEYGQTEMGSALARTRAELEQWMNM